jgi:hypothetical protein
MAEMHLPSSGSSSSLLNATLQEVLAGEGQQAIAAKIPQPCTSTYASTAAHCVY